MKSILFLRPDLNSTFAQTKSLKKYGVKTRIFLGLNYPEKLIFKKDEVIGKEFFKVKHLVFKILNSIINFFQLLYYSIKSEYIIYYGNPPLNPMFDRLHPFNKFSLELYLLKIILKKKLIYQPSGCMQEYLKKEFEKFDEGNICGNCGHFNKCDDTENQKNFDLVNKYFDLKIGSGFSSSNQYPQDQFKFKSIDLDLFSPEISVPKNFLLKNFDGITIYHSNFLRESGRVEEGKNIKGTGFIIDAIRKLKKEGYKLRELILDDIPNRHLRYYQVQADIIVDQLIYGQFGHTAVECMALGKPVICYLRPQWKEFYLKTYPEHRELPIIEANTDNIYLVIKNLLDNQNLIKKFGVKSRDFVKRQYNPDINSRILLKKLNCLK